VRIFHGAKGAKFGDEETIGEKITPAMAQRTPSSEKVEFAGGYASAWDQLRIERVSRG